MEVLENDHNTTIRIREGQYESINRELRTYNDRLDRLLDLISDGDIEKTEYNRKVNQIKDKIFDLESRRDNLDTPNIDVFNNISNILELSKSLYSKYLLANLHIRGQLANIVASNYSLKGLSLYPTYRKPFGVIAKGLLNDTWLPGQDSLHHYILQGKLTKAICYCL